MRKLIRAAGRLQVINRLIRAFRKTGTRTQPGLQLTPAKARQKVNAWLDRQRAVANRKSAAAIRSLQHHLEFGRLRFEQLSAEEQFIIIPLKQGFQTGNNRDKHPVHNLVLISDETGRISKGNIVQYVAADGVPGVIPPGTFSNLFNEKTLECSGQFTFLTITDRYLYEMNYENGSIHSFKQMRPGTIAASHAGFPDDAGLPADDTCMDWYLVSTVYHTDGAIEIFEDHLGRTGDGRQPDLPGMHETLCDEFGGDTGYLYAGPRDVNWSVAAAANHLWHVRAGAADDPAENSTFSRRSLSFFDAPVNAAAAASQTPGAGRFVPGYRFAGTGGAGLRVRTRCWYRPPAS